MDHPLKFIRLSFRQVRYSEASMMTTFTCMNFLHASSGVDVAFHRSSSVASKLAVCVEFTIFYEQVVQPYENFGVPRELSLLAPHLFLTGLCDIVSF